MAIEPCSFMFTLYIQPTRHDKNIENMKKNSIFICRYADDYIYLPPN